MPDSLHWPEGRPSLVVLPRLVLITRIRADRRIAMGVTRSASLLALLFSAFFASSGIGTASATASMQSTSTGTRVLASQQDTLPVALLNSADIRTVFVSQDTAIQHIRGASARAHLRELRRKSKKGFGVATADLRRRGYRPTDHVYVSKVIRFASLNPSEARSGSVLRTSMRPQQYSEQFQEGEVTFWSWDDGYDGTWEGVLYAENYSNGGWQTHEAQLNIEVDGNYWTVWHDRVAGEGGGGAPLPVSLDQEQESGDFLGQFVTAVNQDKRSSEFVTLRASGVSAAASSSFVSFGPIDYYWCAFWGCLGAAVGCGFLGPAAPPCFFATCTAVLIGCIAQL